LTPQLQESLVRLSSWMPFARAAVELKHFTHTDVSRPTVERLTEAAGAAYVAFQSSEVVRIEQTLPAPPAGAAQQLLSVDGAMVPLVGGEWAEVRTLVIGEVKPPLLVKGESVIQTTALSYFSRLSDAERFQRLALVETQRRGVESAQAVAAVSDGAEWIQKFVDFHRPDAVRILDFAHAGERLTLVGQTCFGRSTPAGSAWLAAQLHELKHAGPTAVLASVQNLLRTQPDAPDLPTHLAYLTKRTAHMQYPTFQQAGWPIGSGAVESANKLVVEARLKGSGMHWAPAHVDPMLALRNIVCSDRWDEAWPQITCALRQQAHQRRTDQRQKRRLRRTDQVTLDAPATAPPTRTPRLTPLSQADSLALTPSSQQNAHPPTPPRPPRPPANHPWRRMPIGRARYQPSISSTYAKS
jgi:hypothetical protein